MTQLKRRYIIEASFALFLLAILLYFMVPRFLSAQKYGPMSAYNSQPISGTWIWEDNYLIQSDLNSTAVIVFRPFLEEGELSFKTYLEEGEDGIQIIFGYRSPQDYYLLYLGRVLKIEPSMYYYDGKSIGSSIGDQFELKLAHGVWHDIRFRLRYLSEYRQYLADWYVNHEKILESTLYGRPNYKSFSDLQQGQFGLGTTKTVAKFKDIKITPLDKEP